MLCLCKTPSKTVSDGEICCRKCGVVFGLEDVVTVESKAKLSLFLRQTTGSTTTYKPENKSNKRIQNDDNDLNVLSAVCGKLQMPRSLEEDVWTAYNELRNMFMQRPNAAAFAIYRAIRLNDLAILDKDVIDTIMMMFRVQRVPQYLAVTSEVSKLVITSSKSYLLTDDRRTKSERYYLLVHVKQATRDHPEIPADLLLKNAEPRFNVSTISNADTRAKRAVTQTLIRLGVKL